MCWALWETFTGAAPLNPPASPQISSVPHSRCEEVELQRWQNKCRGHGPVRDMTPGLVAAFPSFITYNILTRQVDQTSCYKRDRKQQHCPVADGRWGQPADTSNLARGDEADPTQDRTVAFRPFRMLRLVSLWPYEISTFVRCVFSLGI